MPNNDTLLVVGAGGHGKVVADAALCDGRWARIGFLDDRAPEMSDVLGIKILGAVTTLALHIARFSSAVVAIGKAERRLELIDACVAGGYQLPVIAHPSATISRFATLGRGTVVLANAAINVGARIGAGVIVNTGATVDHDCEIGDGAHICPGVHLAGHVRIGAGAWIGIGVSVRDGIRIGRSVTVGAGAAVVRDVADGAVVMGVPARPRA